VENETCFARKYQCESHEAHESREKRKMWYIVKLASLAICESCNLQDLQTSKIIIHSEKLVLDQNSRKTPEIKLVMILASLATKFLFVRLVRSKSHYQICLQDSREASLATKFLSASLVRSESYYKICPRDAWEVSLTMKFLSVRLASLASLARISRECWV
jgi:CYTH domain-containing protein